MKNEKMINIEEKLAENVKMKRIIKKSLKKKENFDIIMFEIIDVKNSNAKIFIKYYINNTTTISSNFTKFFFEFESFLKKEDAGKRTRKNKKKIEEKRERELRRDEEEKNR